MNSVAVPGEASNSAPNAVGETVVNCDAHAEPFDKSAVASVKSDKIPGAVNLSLTRCMSCFVLTRTRSDGLPATPRALRGLLGAA